MKKTKTQELTLATGRTHDDGSPNETHVRYRPLPGLDVADYVEEHMERFNATGVFEDLSINGRGITLDAKKWQLDALAVLGSAGANLLTGGEQKKSLRVHVIEHCKRFQVEAKNGDNWVKLFADDESKTSEAVERLNDHLEFADMSELVLTLFMGVTAPLFARLASVAAARQPKSATPSDEPSTAS